MAERGQPLPQWYLDEPELGPLDPFYIHCFWTLCTTRRYPGGPIPWDKIIQYAEYSGLDEDMTGALVVIIQAMDARYLEKEAEDREKQRKRDMRSQTRRPKHG